MNIRCGLLKFVQEHNALLAAVPRQEVVGRRAQRRALEWRSMPEEVGLTLVDGTIYDVERQGEEFAQSASQLCLTVAAWPYVLELDASHYSKPSPTHLQKPRPAVYRSAGSCSSTASPSATPRPLTAR
jgi:hypothetical protein